MSSSARIVDVKPGDPRLQDVLAVLAELRPALTSESFERIYAAAYAEGLRFTAAFEGDRAVAVAGWRLVWTTFANRKLYVDDLVTTEAARSKGYGKLLLDELWRRAAGEGCSLVDLDSAVTRHDAHRFYFREGYRIAGHHFVKVIDAAALDPTTTGS